MRIEIAAVRKQECRCQTNSVIERVDLIIGDMAAVLRSDIDNISARLCAMCIRKKSGVSRKTYP